MLLVYLIQLPTTFTLSIYDSLFQEKDGIRHSSMYIVHIFFFFFQAEDGIRDSSVTGVQTCALPISCDHRIAAPSAVFGHRGASLGVMTGWGGTQRLPRLIGKSRAMQMFLLAEMVDRKSVV